MAHLVKRLRQIKGAYVNRRTTVNIVIDNAYGEGCVLRGQTRHCILYKCVARFVSRPSVAYSISNINRLNVGIIELAWRAHKNSAAATADRTAA